MIFPGQHMPTRTAADRKARDAAFEKWVAEERERVRRQRSYLTSLHGPMRDGIVRRMLDRAWELLDCGEAEATDALLEFVPEADAERLLRDFFPEVYGHPTPVSKGWDFACKCGCGYLDPGGEDSDWTCRECGDALRRPPVKTKTRMRRVGDPNEPYVAPPSIGRWQEKRAVRRSNSA